MTDQNTGDPQFSKGNESTFTKPDDNQGTMSKDNNLEEILRRDKHAQEHIKKLEAERKQDRERLKELEAQLAKARTVDDLMARMQQGNYYRSDDEPTSHADDKQTIDVDALVSAAEKRVLERLSAQEREAQENNNYMTVFNTLKEKHGDHLDTKVSQRAQELGLSIQDMVVTARRSPRAFFELMGEKDVKVPPSSSGGVTNNKGTPELTVDEMLKVMKDPQKQKLWKDPEYQKQLRLKILEDFRKKSNQG